jgi:hypothetical protein
MELAYKKGYDKCHNEAMKYLVEESKKWIIKTVV